MVPSAALMPPAASTVWASSRLRLPMTTTSTPASRAAIAALRPAAPVPMTRTLHGRVRLSGPNLTPSPPFLLRPGPAAPLESAKAEPAELLRVGDDVDLDDAPIGDRERADD